MTVCIVSHSFRENAFVAVMDSMLTTADMSHDRLAIKSFAVGDAWMCMFSANDMSPVVSISNAVKAAIGAPASLEEVIAAFQSAFRKELVAKAEASILAPFNLNMLEFRQSGLASFGPEIFSRIFYQIEQLNLDVTFLVSGFDAHKPHIFTIQNRGEVSHYDQPGFWAIGSGQTSALGSLFSLGGHSVCVRSLEAVLYLLCKAKFSAESAPGVGQNTTAIILKHDGTRFMVFNEAIEPIKQMWLANKPPDAPTGFSELAKTIIKKSLKDYRKKLEKRKARAPKLIGEGSVAATSQESGKR